jgi:hypothetical protein
VSLSGRSGRRCALHQSPKAAGRTLGLTEKVWWEEPKMEKLTRRSFLKTAGVATGVAAVVGVPGVAKAALEEDAVPVEPSAPTPPEPLVAYIRDVERGEVTVLAGTRETTLRDPVLVRRLLKAARIARGGTA